MEQHWNNLFERNFTDLGYVFPYFLRDLKHSIFSLTLFGISMLVFSMLVRKQSSEVVLWRSYFWWTSRKTSVKERILTRVTRLQLYWKCALLQMFFLEIGQNLQSSYFSEPFPVYTKQKSVKYTQWCSLTL